MHVCVCVCVSSCSCIIITIIIYLFEFSVFLLVSYNSSLSLYPRPSMRKGRDYIPSLFFTASFRWYFSVPLIALSKGDEVSQSSIFLYFTWAGAASYLVYVFIYVHFLIITRAPTITCTEVVLRSNIIFNFYFQVFVLTYFIIFLVLICYYLWRCPWCNGYYRRKWTCRHEFKSWTRQMAFHIALIPLGKVWILLFPTSYG